MYDIDSDDDFIKCYECEKEIDVSEICSYKKTKVCKTCKEQYQENDRRLKFVKKMETEVKKEVLRSQNKPVLNPYGVDEMAISAARRPGISVPISWNFQHQHLTPSEKNEMANSAARKSRIEPVPPDTVKIGLCRELFGRTDNGCLDLTMKQLETIKLAFNSGINIITGEHPFQIYEELQKITPVMRHLLELANKYGMYDSRGLLNSKDMFQQVFSIIKHLTTCQARCEVFCQVVYTPATRYIKLLEMRHSISNETFARTVPRGFYPGDTGYDTITASIISIEAEYSFLTMFVHPNLCQFQNRFTTDSNLRTRLLSIMDCIISIMLQLYPHYKY